MAVVAELPYVPFASSASSSGPHPAAGFRWRIGVRPLDLREWLDSGPDAQAWIAEKTAILRDHHSTAVVVLDDVEAESREVGSSIVDHLRTHEPRRGGDAPFDSSRDPSLHPLDAAGRLVAEDLVLMVERDGRLVVGGGSVCFPNRWDLRSKVGRSMEEVHARVDRLNDQLRRPIDHFLERLTPERSYWRLGWGLIDVADGYVPVDGTGPARPVDPRPDAMYVRVERETLRRLPRTRAVLFTIRTFVSPILRVAHDPVTAAALAAALDSMPDDVRAYKGLAETADRVILWLREIS